MISLRPKTICYVDSPHLVANAYCARSRCLPNDVFCWRSEERVFLFALNIYIWTLMDWIVHQDIAAAIACDALAYSLKLPAILFMCQGWWIYISFDPWTHGCRMLQPFTKLQAFLFPKWLWPCPFETNHDDIARWFYNSSMLHIYVTLTCVMKTTQSPSMLTYS